LPPPYSAEHHLPWPLDVLRIDEPYVCNIEKVAGTDPENIYRNSVVGLIVSIA
jgi:hypothetical protein